MSIHLIYSSIHSSSVTASFWARSCKAPIHPGWDSRPIQGTVHTHRHTRKLIHINRQFSVANLPKCFGEVGGNRMSAEETHMDTARTCGTPHRE